MVVNEFGPWTHLVNDNKFLTIPILDMFRMVFWRLSGRLSTRWLLALNIGATWLLRFGRSLRSPYWSPIGIPLRPIDIIIEWLLLSCIQGWIRFYHIHLNASVRQWRVRYQILLNILNLIQIFKIKASLSSPDSFVKHNIWVRIYLKNFFFDVLVHNWLLIRGNLHT